MARLIYPSSLAALLALSGAIHAQEKAPPAPAAIEPEAYQQVEVLMRAIETIRENYVDEEKITYPELIDAALEGMFARLDTHSQYMNPRLFEEVRQTTPNPVNTSGITLGGKEGSLRITALREAGPALRSGLRLGDRLLAIDGKKLTVQSAGAASLLLDGNPGELLTVEIERGAPGSTRTIGFQREAPLAESVTGTRMLDAETGYARIQSFREPTGRELADALDQLEADGMKRLVLDLRGNPGGLLDSAFEVCGEFLPPKTLVASSRGREEKDHSEEFHTPATQRRLREYPVAVLIDQESASSAEIVAGALQDLKRAKLVGSKSFGKGSIQTVIQMGMDTGAAMRLTTARLYTPKGRAFDGVGLTPDLSVDKDKDAIVAATKMLATAAE